MSVFRRDLYGNIGYLGQTRDMRKFAVKQNLKSVEEIAIITDEEVASLVENYCIENEFRIFYENECITIIDLENRKEWIFER